MQRPGLRSTSTKNGKVSRANALITEGRQKLFADWNRPRSRHVPEKCAWNCPQPCGVEMSVCRLGTEKPHGDHTGRPLGLSLSFI
jgi:hypothetical protein